MTQAVMIPETTTRRRLEVRCARKNCNVKNDSVYQSRHDEHSVEWLPDAARTLSAQGWVEQAEQLFCSKQCAHVYAYTSKQPLATEAVTHIADVQYQATIGKRQEAPVGDPPLLSPRKPKK